jgi:hypothetical protein
MEVNCMIKVKEKIRSVVPVIGFLVMAVLLLGLSGQVQAAEMKAGDMITKDNWEQVKNNTFHGDKIEDLVTEKLAWQIQNWELKMELKDYEKFEFPPEMQAYTQQFKDTVKLSDGGRKLENYQAGIPFPDELDPKDPLSAWKVIWNTMYGRHIGDCIRTPNFAYVLVDGKRGYERMQVGEWANYYYKNRTKIPPVPVHETDDNYYLKNLLFFVYPFDIRGLGVLALKYDDERLEQSWAYLRSVRRIRRLSSAAWMDPIGGTDQLYDDQEIWNARPEWYDSFNYLGKKKMLIVRNMPYLIWEEDEKSVIDQFPLMDLKTAPYWQPLSLWEPAQVHVLETIPPKHHPYSKKTIYIDDEEWKPLLSEMYDRKGEFWKFFHVGGAPKPDPWGREWVISVNGHIQDYQKMHCTQWNNSKDFNMNTEGLTVDFFTVDRLKAAGK